MHVDLDVDAPLASVTALLGPPLTEEDLPVLVNFTIVDTSSSSSSVFAQLVYTPKKDIVGTNIDSFTYFVSDTFSQSIPKAVTFDVVNINDAPTLPTLIWRPTEEYVVTEIDPRTFKGLSIVNMRTFTCKRLSVNVQV